MTSCFTSYFWKLSDNNCNYMYRVELGIKFKTKCTVSRPPDNPTRFFKPNQDEFCAKKRKINYNRGYKLFTLV